ncbi:HIRAN domain-containing protein [Mobiluncus porci]|uniref:HIRAN domain-containing protein n=1 Tax=Mobiluncus porci TaxID=2652278 RepID=A0A7K0K230_9ACTO|nr:HIRAN domain-containing protein [Mobiluncus porci]MST49484.1 hypothetical protein [Mobiluncus porci]
MGIFDIFKSRPSAPRAVSQYQVTVDSEGFTIAGASYRQAAFKQFAKSIGASRDYRYSVKVFLIPERDNQADPDAIAVYSPQMQHLGYVPADLTPKFHAMAPKTRGKQVWRMEVDAQLYFWKNLWLLNIFA